MNAQNIKRILRDQQEELKAPAPKPWVERDIIGKAQSALSSALVKVITGPRRSGKSSLALRMLHGRRFAYANFDDENLAGIEAKDLNGVLEAWYELDGKPEFVLLDEVQNVAGWELFVNRLHRLGINVVVTGSNAHLLSRELATHLTGRHLQLELYPFSFREFLRFKGAGFPEILSTSQTAEVKVHLENYLAMGGFPEVYAEPLPGKYLKGLYQAILTQDIALRHHIRYVPAFRQIAHALISNFACLTSYNKLKNAFSLKSVHTIQKYVAYMEESYLLFSLTRFSHKIKERSTAPVKLHGIDPGLIRAMAPERASSLGYLYENVAAIELKRRTAWDENLGVYYWHGRDGEEVDFAITRGRKVVQLIQVCVDPGRLDTRAREEKALANAAVDLRCEDLLVLTGDMESRETFKGKTIRYAPLWKWLMTETPF